MRVVFVASEISPYASTGGLADVAGSLPEALQQQGIDVIRIMPMYRSLLEGVVPLKDSGLRLQVPVGLRTLQAEIWQTEGQGPATYFIRKDEFFDRRELYSLPERDYDDNFERFVFFQKAAVGLIDTLNVQPDIVHANDWQTGLMPYFLDYGMLGMGRGRAEKVLFTIHNLAYQGLFDDREFPYTNLPYSCFSLEEIEYYGNINCMKAAIVRSDRLTTVSRRYAQEILTPEFGCGLEGVLQQHEQKLTGILNGVDYSTWDPSTDILIAETYMPEDLSGKSTCKKALLEKMGLDNSPAGIEKPLIGMVTRLVDQKGLDLLREAMDHIMAEDVQFVLLGSGQEDYHMLCEKWADQWPARFAVFLGYNNGLAHQIEAGADIFLMPSRFEPCGLNQLYSLRYGTVPVVHGTGGLDDTIDHYERATSSGNGFKFEEYTATNLLAVFKECVQLYRSDKVAWTALQKQMMAEDHSWSVSAEAYINVYQNMENPKGPIGP